MIGQSQLNFTEDSGGGCAAGNNWAGRRVKSLGAGKRVKSLAANFRRAGRAAGRREGGRQAGAGGGPGGGRREAGGEGGRQAGEKIRARGSGAADAPHFSEFEDVMAVFFSGNGQTRFELSP